jgi:hypothetical protein
MTKIDRLCVTAALPPSSIEPPVPRGVKRSRSPDQYGELAGEEDLDGTSNLSGDPNGPLSDAAAEDAVRSLTSALLVLFCKGFADFEAPYR